MGVHAVVQRGRELGVLRVGLAEPGAGLGKRRPALKCVIIRMWVFGTRLEGA